MLKRKLYAAVRYCVTIIHFGNRYGLIHTISLCLKILFCQFAYGIIWKLLSIIHLDLFQFSDEFFHQIYGFRTMSAMVRVMPDKPELIVDFNLGNQHINIIGIIQCVLTILSGTIFGCISFDCSRNSSLTIRSLL